MKLIANQTLPREAQAFLMALYVGESGGDYTILYGGSHFTAPPWVHPNRPIPIPGTDLHSTAAGAPQFLYSTWQTTAAANGFTDFSPANQDAGAWWLAQVDYHAKTGGSLLTVLQAGHLQGIAAVLKPTWTSLSESTFPERYAAAWALIVVGVPQTPAQTFPAPAASTAPEEGILMNFLAYIGQRMTEASSWGGTAAFVLGAMHIANAADITNAAVGVAVAIGGLIGVLVKEKGATA